MRKVDHEGRRQEVAAAAARLIAREGLDALTTRALAKELGCSIGVLSHYFNSKVDIVNAAFQWADQRIDDRVQEAMAGAELTFDVFIPIVRATLPLDQDSELEWRVRFNLYTYAFTDDELRDTQREKLQNFKTLMCQLVEQLQARGELRADLSPTLLTRAVFDITMGAALNLLRLPIEERSQQGAYLFDLLDSLKPERGSLQAVKKQALA